MEIPRLHPDTIEEIKDRVDIYDIASDYVVLRRRGKDFVGLCPFHEEKTPSFTVSPAKQMYYCFGCGAGGNGINFLMELGKRSFSDVVLELARRYQVPVKTLEPEKRQQLQQQISLREQLYEVLAIASSFYQHTLRQPAGKIALDYLQNTRHLQEETIQQFQLGYAPDGWENLYGYLVEQKKFPVQLIEKAGLIKPRQNHNSYYDVFRKRLMIPIQDIQGRVIGFGGRALDDQELPKYLNSPETELFDKGKTLFGLDKAKNSIIKLDQAVVVEGYFDVIALHAVGISNVVASLGTALSLDQIRHLLRYTESKQIILNFDADQAGIKATERAIGEMEKLVYQGEVQLRVFSLPDGKDADEFLSSYSPDKYRELLNNSPFWIDWQLEKAVAGKNLKQADQFQKVSAEITSLLGRLESIDQQSHYIQKSAELLSQGDPRLIPILADSFLKKFKPTKSVHRQKFRQNNWVNKNQIERNLLAETEALLLRLYLHCPEYRQDILNALQAKDLEFSLSHHRLLWRQILYVHEREITGEKILEALQEFYQEFPQGFSQVAHLFNLDETSQKAILRAPLLIRAATAAMERVMCERQCRYFMEAWQKANLATNREQAHYYAQKLSEIKRRIQELDELRRTTFYDLISVPWIGF